MGSRGSCPRGFPLKKTNEIRGINHIQNGEVTFKSDKKFALSSLRQVNENNLIIECFFFLVLTDKKIM
jgi:hypothetical protein